MAKLVQNNAPEVVVVSGHVGRAFGERAGFNPPVRR